MRCSILTPLIILLFIQGLFAEGSRELAPNQNININGNLTNDIAALHINSPNYNFFASYTNPDPNNRLHINIQDPTSECIYLGFSGGHPNFTGQNPPPVNFEYRILDPNGNVVYGPITVANTQANINSWSEATTGPQQLFGAGGYDAMEVTPADLTSQGWTGPGDYYIQFRELITDQAFLIDYWDITVADCSGMTPAEKTGRVWSYNWAFFAINDFGFPERPFNGAFYVCAPDPGNPDAAFITKIDFNGAGFRPAAFNIAFNSFGSQNTGNIVADRRSLRDQNGTQAEYKIYLNDPVDVCETSVPGQIDLLGITRCSADEYNVKFTSTKEGQVDLLLDFDGQDGIFTPGTADLIITQDVDSAEVNNTSCIPWDGKDGLGNTLLEDTTTQIPVVLSYAQGIYHFPVYDAEFLTDGFNITAVRPAGPDPLLYYDDSNILVSSGSGEPQVQLAGCVLPCHRWTNYTTPDAIGFGNLNTINSWWFSQQIVTEDLLFMPAYYECEPTGPDQICENTTEQLSVAPVLFPEGVDSLDILGYNWSGPGLVGASDQPTVEINDGGTYEVEIAWLTELGDTCRNTCSIDVAFQPTVITQIDTVVNFGDTLMLNGENYTTETSDTQYFSGQTGCDSLVVINVTVIQIDAAALHYTLDDCNSLINSGDNADYSEFTPSYPTPLICGGLEASFVFRENPLDNIHSCTPGVNGEPAMCIGSNDNCTYDDASDKSVVFEVTIQPEDGRTIAISGFEFYERAPTTFDWIGGSTGPNNYPTLYAVRVLKDGVEIFRQEDLATTDDWTLETFDFANNNEFTVDDTTTFRFELQGYCTVGNGAMVNAWDLDEFDIQASCLASRPHITGNVKSVTNEFIPDVEMQLSTTPFFRDFRTKYADEQGDYQFTHNHTGSKYFVKAYKNDQWLEGISALDIIYIRKHILGLAVMQSPYQMIAADVNGSNSISTLDIIALRQLLLGTKQEISGNTSWRFIVNKEAKTATVPWNFEEVIYIRELYRDQEQQNFTGIKVGDVNGQNQFVTGQSATRSREPLQLMVQDVAVEQGNPVSIDVTSPNFNRIHGFQITLSLDNVDIQDVESSLLDELHYFIDEAHNEVRILWTPAEAQTFSRKDVLFSIRGMPTQKGKLEGHFHKRDISLPAEAYWDDELLPSGIQIHIVKPEIPIAKSALYQNIPNPVSNTTTIQFFMANSGEANLVFTDISGRILHSMSGYYTSGMHEVEVHKSALGDNEGIILYQFQTEGFVETKRMLLME